MKNRIKFTAIVLSGIFALICLFGSCSGSASPGNPGSQEDIENPTNPADPSNPTDPTNPSNPTDPSNPSTPDTPSGDYNTSGFTEITVTADNIGRTIYTLEKNSTVKATGQFDNEVFSEINVALSSNNSEISVIIDLSEAYGITQIPERTLVNSEKLAGIILPKDLTYIGECAFLHCLKLTSITIPEKVTEIGKQAFLQCDNLEKVFFEQTCNWYTGNSPIELSTPEKNAEYLTQDYSDKEWTNHLPDTTTDIILYSNDDYIQKITDFSCSSVNQEINIYVLGQINSDTLTTISRGITSLTQAYYNEISQITKPQFDIYLDLSKTTGLTKLSSNCMTLGNNGFDDSLNVIIKFPDDTCYIAPDAFTNSAIINQLIIDEEILTIDTTQTGIMKLYDGQNRNVVICNNTAALAALDNGVTVIFNKDEMFVEENSRMCAQIETENKTLCFNYYAKDFHDNLAQYFIPFSKAGNTFRVIYNPDKNRNSNNNKSISIDALGGNGFPVQQAFYDLELSLSYEPDDGTFYVSHNTTANYFSDFFTTPRILKNNNIHYDFYLANDLYAFNNVTFDSSSAAGTYQEKAGEFTNVYNIFSYIKSHQLSSITYDSSVNIGNYINKTCTVKLNFSFTLDDDNETEFYIEPDIKATCTVTEQTIDPASGLTITAADLWKIKSIKEDMPVKAKGYFSADDISQLADSILYLKALEPEVFITLDLSEVTGVSEIENYTFKNCSNISSIVVPSSITSFGYHCFEGCVNLKTVYYNGTLEQWCNMSFTGWSNPCCNEADLYFNNELVTEITIPDSITSLGDYAFSSCTSLKKVIFPDTTQVQSIGECAFSCCFNLTSINLPDTIDSIEKYTFYQCKSLQRITIPKYVISIKSLAFKSCENLTRVSFKGKTGWEAENESISVDNAYTAAEYLRNTYVSKDWERDPITSFSFSTTRVQVPYDETYQIELTAFPSDYIISMNKVSFTSNNSKITVSDTGLVSYTGSQPGTEEAKITATFGKHTDNMNITFYIPVTDISLDKSLIILGKDSEPLSLSATVLPENASYKTITWQTNDSDVCTVENGIITVNNSGTAKITATAGNKKTTAIVYVINTSDSFTYNPAALTQLSNAGDYTGYTTDSAQKIAYAFTTKAHKSITGIPGNTGKLDIIAKNANAWKASTYNNAGWAYKINDTVVSLDSTGKASAGALALQVVPLLVYDNGKPSVLIVNVLTNTGDAKISSIKFGAGTDIKIAANDYAPVIYNAQRVTIFDSDSSMIFTLKCLEGTAVTPVNNLWIGSCNDGAMNNVYNNSRTSIDDTDSALAYSWQNITLFAGETKIFAVLLSSPEDEGGALEAIIY